MTCRNNRTVQQQNMIKLQFKSTQYVNAVCESTANGEIDVIYVSSLLSTHHRWNLVKSMLDQIKSGQVTG